jgi:hypothetical protein
MSVETLGTYLNDHLAGSVGAIEMVERVIRENDGEPLALGLEKVLPEIKADQAVLVDLIERIGARESPLKKAGAWLAEKAGRVKLGGTGEPEALSRLEMLETLIVGMHGRRSLWRALSTVVDRHPVLLSLDLDLLERRAQEQHDFVEQLRLEAAREVL